MSLLSTRVPRGRFDRFSPFTTSPTTRLYIANISKIWGFVVRTQPEETCYNLHEIEFFRFVCNQISFICALIVHVLQYKFDKNEKINFEKALSGNPTHDFLQNHLSFRGFINFEENAASF